MGVIVTTRAYMVVGEQEPGWLSGVHDALLAVGCVDSLTFVSHSVPPVLLVHCHAEPTEEQLEAMEGIINGGDTS